MAQRVIITSSIVKISRPGFDVNNAPENGLLLSLNNRSAQIITKGFLAFTGTDMIVGNGTVNPDHYYSGSANQYFPALSEPPDVLVQLVLTTNENYPGNVTNIVNQNSYINNTVFNDHFFTEVYCDRPYIGVSYIILRKKATG